MGQFEFATAARIIFGSGTFQKVSEHVSGFGRRALVVTGQNIERAKPLLDQLGAADLDALPFPVAGEPTVDDVTAALRTVQEAKRDFVIGFGGGSALDAAKAVAALATNPGEPLDYLEVVGRGQPLREPALPCVAIPTTAGTGAEVTRNAVLSAPTHRVKVSLRGAFLLPRLALVDPVLTHGLPPDVTARTGLDALTQLIEPYLSIRANPLTDALCREGVTRAARSLRRAFDNGSDANAREDMATASLFGGIALANAGLGAVHGFAAPIGGMFKAPHGAVCAALLPAVLEVNLRALRSRQPDAETVPRFQAVAGLLTGSTTADAADGIRWIAELCTAVRVPPLGTYGITRADFEAIVAKAEKASSMMANPIVLNREELTECLERSV